jgi:3-carboxy-cis,cis-muconate cycloisomerase
MRIYDRLLRCDEVDKILSESSLLERMLAFEAALAESEGQLGIIPERAAAAIARQCTLDSLDVPALSTAAAKAGNLAVPLVRQLTSAVGNVDPEAARYVHWGATSQDVIDTALVLQTRDAIHLISAELDRICERLAELTHEHRDTVMTGRTWLQHAAPITFGLKTANMLSGLMWHRDQLRDVSREFAVVQLGGSVGTLVAFRGNGPAVVAAVAHRLGLAIPKIPWHANRERVARLATEFGILSATLGKIARDISLLEQTEVAEVAERWEEARGESSTMPQKRNPIGTAVVLSLVLRVPGIVSTLLASMIQEHERGLGGWQAEWELLPELISMTAAIVHHGSQLLNGLKVDVHRMRANLELTAGTIYAEAISFKLAERIGKPEAHRLVSRATARSSERRAHLKSILLEDPEVTAHMTPDEISELFDPFPHLGSTSMFIDAVLAEHEIKSDAIR